MKTNLHFHISTTDAMKHIKRKFLNEVQLVDGKLPEALKGLHQIHKKDVVNGLSLSKDAKTFLSTDNGKVVEAFYINIDGKKYLIPEPDPVLIYFDSAQRQLKSIVSVRKEMLENYLIDSEPRNLDIHKTYVHFELCAVFVISLFTSIETFINRLIPDDFIFTIKSKNKTESYDKDQIQRYLSFDKKIQDVIPQVTKLSFEKSRNTNFKYIINLKEFRDSIIHTKTDKGENNYSDIYKKAIKFKYKETLDAVCDFLNFYSSQLVEECDCGADF